MPLGSPGPSCGDPLNWSFDECVSTRLDSSSLFEIRLSCGATGETHVRLFETCGSAQASSNSEVAKL